jgi:hypothetical protein
LWLAERVGFEPTCPLRDKTLSRRPRYDHFGTSPVGVRQVRLKPDTTYGTREACAANVSLYRPLVSRLQIDSAPPPFLPEERLDDRAALVLEHTRRDEKAMVETG